MQPRFILAVSILVLLKVTLAWAQAPASTFKYDIANEVTIKGVVQEVKDFQCPASGGMGAHLVVKTDKGLVTVHLALSKFLSEYGLNFAKGDEVQITGVKAKVGDDENAILARTIERGNQTFTFRDKKGKPLW
jgi:DNA/RNA endonuclease YhcR with UshA esterase domain